MKFFNTVKSFIIICALLGVGIGGWFGGVGWGVAGVFIGGGVGYGCVLLRFMFNGAG